MSDPTLIVLLILIILDTDSTLKKTNQKLEILILEYKPLIPNLNQVLLNQFQWKDFNNKLYV